MTTNPLKGLIIRDAVVRNPEVGFILAGDPKKEYDEIAHVILFTWHKGKFVQGSASFNAHTSCIIEIPEYGVVRVSGPGSYSVETRKGSTVGNIHDDSQPKPKEPKYGDFRSVVEIGGKAYAVGHDGMVCRLDSLNQWTRIDEGLPGEFDIEGIHGFAGDDIYATGFKGQLWHFNGKIWNKLELPTNTNLSRLRCMEDENVYIGGHGGILVRGRGNQWTIIDHDETNKDIWGISWFNDEAYISTMSMVYRLKGQNLEPVNFGEDPPRTTYQLSAAKDVLWSIGEKDIMSFDGKRWTRIV